MSPRLGDLLLTSQSDERLVALARAGHERAFAVIVERYRPELHAFARRLSADGNGEDVLQQAFLGAFVALRSGAEVEHLRGWLYRIVRNAAARSRTPVCVQLDGAIAGLAAVEDVVEQRALALDALAALARLPSRQREAILGTALDGRARAEVASSMGLSDGAVRQLIHRARAKLRTAVTAVTPWPLVRWICGGPSGGGNAVEAAAGAGAAAASSGGFVGLKLGVVLASGAIATGVAAVDIHGSGRPSESKPSVRAAAPAGHRHAAGPRVHAVELAAVAPAPAVVTRREARPVVYRAPARSSRSSGSSRMSRMSRRSRRSRTSRAASTPVGVYRPDRRREDGVGATDASYRWGDGGGGRSRGDGGGDRGGVRESGGGFDRGGGDLRGGGRDH